MVKLLEMYNEYSGYGYDENKKFKPNEATIKDIRRAVDYSREMMLTILDILDEPYGFDFVYFLKHFQYCVFVGDSKTSAVEAVEKAINDDLPGDLSFAKYVFVSIRFGNKEIQTDLVKVEKAIRKLGKVNPYIEIVMKMEYKEIFGDYVEAKIYC